jgi:hypothetical protein
MSNFDFETGRRYLEEGDIVEAIRCLLASLDVDRSHVPTYIALFEAYEAAWHDSGDPDVLDQMRKVALAGLKRGPTEEQRRFLDEGLDRTEECIIHVQRAEHGEVRERGEHEAHGAKARPKGGRHLPLIGDLDASPISAPPPGRDDTEGS